MAHILEFKITGLLGRKKAYHQVLNRDTNIFFGTNGSGKTSLLKILHAALNRETESLQNIVFKSAEVKIFSVKFNRIFTHKLEKSFHKELLADFFSEEQEETTTSIPNRNEWQVTPQTIDGKVIKSAWQHRFLSTTRLYVAQNSDERSTRRTSASLSEDDLDTFFNDSIQRVWSSTFADVLSTIKNAQEEGLQLVLREVLEDKDRDTLKSSVPPDVAFKRLRSFLDKQQGKDNRKLLGSEVKFTERYEKNAMLRNVANHINKVETDIDVAIQPITKLRETLASMLSGGKEIKFLGREIVAHTESGTPISLGHLSSGEKHLIRILLDSLEADGNTIIIDEPELSMHIDWQRKLIAAISEINPNCQLIIATHSPEIMADVDDEKIFVL
ncbi:AAA family ATPase [Undibacterium aquatile]|uniref:ATP-binding protein n=1 Tax=Undibacterium aquatile TaxID=1537398 RepID=A0ABR6XIM7_9BURK|nr:AAA family ATPase [Undibacterium aquatile]MBC3812174.1 ATP-binding protein [Undibacterium aquatile]